jgi:hypothetical protein
MRRANHPPRGDPQPERKIAMTFRSISKMFMPIVVVVLTGVFAGPLLGESVEKKTVVKTLNLTDETTVNGTLIRPGQYRLVIKIKDNQLLVEKMDNKVIAESPIQWKRLDARARSTTLYFDSGALTEVRIGGTHDAVNLVGSATPALTGELPLEH